MRGHGTTGPRRGARVGALLLTLLAGVTPADADVLAGRVVVIEAPPTIRAGDTSTAIVEVTNLGRDDWPAGGAIRLAYHVRDAGGRVLVFDGERTTLPARVEPGRAMRLCARLTAPRTGGAVVIEWDLVHEGVTWLSEVSPRATAAHPVTVVVQGAPPLRAQWPTIVWLLLTLGHMVLCGVWGIHWRRTAAAMTVDEAAFTAVIVWLGSLSAVLHAAAATVGMSLWSVGAGLIGVQGLLHWSVGRRAPTSPPDRRDLESGSDRWLERAGVAVLLAIAVGWIAGDLRSPAVGGTDAAHYHVPNAVNLALGARLFDPPATGHLYPMGTSVLAAWLILPTGTTLLVDTATLPSFLMLAGALGWLFRQTTGVSGLSVVPWFLLALLTLPILRISAAMSADLPFAAAFIALLAQVVAMLRGDRSAVALVLTGLLTGLLLGTKTTGVPAAVILLGLLAAGAGVQALTQRRDLAVSAPAFTTVALAIALAVAAGGLWQVRNWRNYGSPVAPIGLTAMGTTIFPGQPYDGMRLHLSVLRDLREHGGQRAWRTARRHIRNWAGPWLPLVGWLLPLVLVDALVARFRGISPALAGTRLVFMIVAVAATGAVGWLLIGAPWTSLVWTNGRSLRYVLPAVVLGAFLAPLAAFPISLPWYRTGRNRLGGTLILAAATIAIAAGVAPPPEQHFGRHLLTMTPWTMAAGAAGAAGLALMAWWPTSRKRLVALVVAGTAVTAVIAGSAISARATHLKYSAAQPQVPAPCPGAQADRQPPELAAATLIDRHDRLREHSHLRRRVFVAARFDTPLALQGLELGTLVFDAGDVRLLERRMEWDGPGTGGCDYVIGSIAELETERGTPLVTQLGASLVPLGDAGSYRVWHVAPRGVAR